MVLATSWSGPGGVLWEYLGKAAVQRVELGGQVAWGWDHAGKELPALTQDSEQVTQAHLGNKGKSLGHGRRGLLTNQFMGKEGMYQG